MAPLESGATAGKWTKYSVKDERYIIPTIHFEAYAKEMDQRMKLVCHKTPMRYDFYDVSQFMKDAKGQITRLMVIRSPEWKVVDFSTLKKRNATSDIYVVDATNGTAVLNTHPAVGTEYENADENLSNALESLRDAKPEVSVKLNRTTYRGAATGDPYVMFDYDIAIMAESSPTGQDIPILEDKYCIMSVKSVDPLPVWLTDMQGRFRSHRAGYTMYEMAKTILDINRKLVERKTME